MAKKLSKFGAEFAKQRAAGAKEFSFGGKKYNTKVKGEGGSKKKSSLPSTAKVPPAKPMMQKAPSYNREQAFDGMAHSPKVSSVKKSSSPSKPYMKDSSTLNDFKQKEARRSSDQKTGAKNAPKVKKAIGKFMLGKGYKG